MATVKLGEGFLQEEERLKDEIVRKHGKTVEELYHEREKRMRDAIQLREPDRVPVMLGGAADFAAKYSGLTLADAYSDAGAWREAYKRLIIDFEPDSISRALDGVSGMALKTLDPTGFKWPGDGLSVNSMHQIIETEPMKADEYDVFLSDPGDFILRYYLPRTWKAMAPLSKLPPLQSLVGASTLATQSHRFSSPEIVKALEALLKAGQEQKDYLETSRTINTFEDQMAALGFPTWSYPGGLGLAPFDMIGDNLRHMQGVMTDMYRQPEKLLAACEKILQWRIARAAPADPNKRGNPKMVIAGWHRGADGFMSKKQFETFYWPTWKKAMLKNIELGFVNMLVLQGRCDSRLEYFLEIPKGKIVAKVCETDAAKVKAILGGHHCVAGGVPHILLQSGSPQEVEEYCRNLIKVCGKGGGYILSTSAGPTNEAKPENVRAMIDSVKKYGSY